MHLPGFSRRGSLVGAAAAASAALALSVPPALAATSYHDSQANQPQVAEHPSSPRYDAATHSDVFVSAITP